MTIGCRPRHLCDVENQWIEQKKRRRENSQRRWSHSDSQQRQRKQHGIHDWPWTQPEYDATLDAADRETRRLAKDEFEGFSLSRFKEFRFSVLQVFLAGVWRLCAPVTSSRAGMIAEIKLHPEIASQARIDVAHHAIIAYVPRGNNDQRRRRHHQSLLPIQPHGTCRNEQYEHWIQQDHDANHASQHNPIADVRSEFRNVVQPEHDSKSCERIATHRHIGNSNYREQGPCPSSKQSDKGREEFATCSVNQKGHNAAENPVQSHDRVKGSIRERSKQSENASD